MVGAFEEKDFLNFVKSWTIKQNLKKYKKKFRWDENKINLHEKKEDFPITFNKVFFNLNHQQKNSPGEQSTLIALNIKTFPL